VFQAGLFVFIQIASLRSESWYRRHAASSLALWERRSCWPTHDFQTASCSPYQLTTCHSSRSTSRSGVQQTSRRRTSLSGNIATSLQSIKADMMYVITVVTVFCLIC